jgi:hypothetical protein
MKPPDMADNSHILLPKQMKQPSKGDNITYWLSSGDQTTNIANHKMVAVQNEWRSYRNISIYITKLPPTPKIFRDKPRNRIFNPEDYGIYPVHQVHQSRGKIHREHGRQTARMECIPTATVPRRPQTVSAERRDGQEFSDSFTDLHMATYYGVQNILESLVVSNRKIDSHSRTPLWQAARDGQVAVVRLLLQEGAAVDSKDGLHCRTPLWWAAGNGHLAVVRLLLEKGAAVDSEDRQGRTPLWSAKETGHEVLVQLLESVSKRG